jgi:hypothetical protein
VRAKVYLSNTGSAAYLGEAEELRMARNGILSSWLDFKDPDAEPLSAIHHLFTLGPEAARLIQ